MQNREMQRDKQVAQMLFTLKIMFMLFSMFPVFEKAFGDRKSGTLTQVKPSLMGILILVAAVGVLGVFLFSTFAEFKKRRVVLLLELPLFFAFIYPDALDVRPAYEQLQVPVFILSSSTTPSPIQSRWGSWWRPAARPWCWDWICSPGTART